MVLAKEKEEKYTRTLQEMVTWLEQNNIKFNKLLNEVRSLTTGGMNILPLLKSSDLRKRLSILNKKNNLYSYKLKNTDIYSVLYFLLVRSEENGDSERDTFEDNLRELILAKYGKKTIIEIIYNQLKEDGYLKNGIIDIISLIYLSILTNTNIVLLRIQNKQLVPICMPNFVGTDKPYIYILYLGNDEFQPIVKCEKAKDSQTIVLTKNFRGLISSVKNQIENTCHLNPYKDLSEEKKYQV